MGNSYCSMATANTSRSVCYKIVVDLCHTHRRASSDIDNCQIGIRVLYLMNHISYPMVEQFGWTWTMIKQQPNTYENGVDSDISKVFKRDYRWLIWFVDRHTMPFMSRSWISYDQYVWRTFLCVVCLDSIMATIRIKYSIWFRWDVRFLVCCYRCCHNDFISF
jgi:hypothetical protein